MKLYASRMDSRASTVEMLFPRMTIMPMSTLSFSSTALSSTRFMNWSKPRSVPVTCLLALRCTAGGGEEVEASVSDGQDAARSARRGAAQSAAKQRPGRTAELLVHEGLEFGGLNLHLRVHSRGLGCYKRVSELPPRRWSTLDQLTMALRSNQERVELYNPRKCTNF